MDNKAKAIWYFSIFISVIIIITISIQNYNVNMKLNQLLTEFNSEQIGVDEKLENKVEKIELQKKQDTSLDKIQTLVKVEPKLPEDLRKAKHITLNFEGTELYDVITTFCELLKIDYVIEGSVDGKVTLQTFNKIPVEDLYSVLEQILALNNVAVVKSGNFYRFLNTPDAAKKPLSIHYSNDPNIPDKERMIIQIVPLKFISVESMKKSLARC